MREWEVLPTLSPGASFFSCLLHYFCTMAIKATICKATVELSDLDRQIYLTQNTVIAQHPSENNERLMNRLLAFALNMPNDDDHGPLEFAKDMWDADEPALWQKDFTGRLLHWIELGQPDEKRLLRASARVDKVSVYNYGPATWWEGIANKLTRAQNLWVWQVPQEQSLALSRLAERTMNLQFTVQDGAVYVSNDKQSVEVTPVKLYGAN